MHTYPALPQSLSSTELQNRTVDRYDSEVNADPLALILLSASLWLLGAIIGILILFLIIRGAVLSALRKHHSEVASTVARQSAQRNPNTAGF